MNTTVLAIRAVTATYARHILKPVFFIGIGVYALVMALIIWISVAVDRWWLVLAIVPTFLIIVGLGAWVLVWKLSGRLSPQMNKKQRAATKKFIHHIDDVAEHIGTPRVVLVFRVLKDVAVRQKTSRTFIGEIAQKPGDMKRDFDDLRKLF